MDIHTVSKILRIGQDISTFIYISVSFGFSYISDNFITSILGIILFTIFIING